MSLLLALVLAARAAEPLLGLAGWMTLGPTADPRDDAADPRDGVRFDPRSCAVEVARVDLDGGPAAREVRLARVWVDGGWRWADDWRIEGGRLIRPGRLPIPLGPGRIVDGERIDADPEGRVVRRRIGGRVLDVLRDPTGAFVGMAEGAHAVRLGPSPLAPMEGRSSDGRRVAYRWDRGRLVEVARDGVQTAYSYGDEGQLVGVGWADGSSVQLDRGRSGTTGIGGSLGAWGCSREGGGATVTRPSGLPWTFSVEADAETLVEPGGARVRVSRVDGRVAGWTWTRGSVRLTRDAEGRLVGIVDEGGRSWVATWSAAGLQGLTDPSGGSWGIRRDAAGARAAEISPSGRTISLTTDAAGRLVGVRRGAGAWTWRLDEAGRVVLIEDPVAGAVKVRRAADGRVEAVVDGGGSTWSLSRDGGGQIRTIVDPGGGEWRIARDALGRPMGVRDPAGQERLWTRSPAGGITSVALAAGGRWALGRDLLGRLLTVGLPFGGEWAGRRDVAGRLDAVSEPGGVDWSLRRDSAGELVGVGPVDVERDAAGWPRRLRTRDGVRLEWARDAAHRVVGVSGVGLAVRVTRDADGQVASWLLGDEAPVALTRDGAGRVTMARGPRGASMVRRDPAGRVTGVSRETSPDQGAALPSAGAPALELVRDLRGLVTRARQGEDWRFHRDGMGRVMSVELGELRLGVDRDVAGRPTLLRFPDGGLARWTWTGGAARVEVTDPAGRALATLAWELDARTRVRRLVCGSEWTVRRDPGGLPVAMESEAGVAWSVAPDRIERPDGSVLWLDAAGRRSGGGRSPGQLQVDALGRLVGWERDGVATAIAWDELGRVVGVGGEVVAGWEAAWSVGGRGVVRVDGAGMLADEDVVVIGPDGQALWSAQRGQLAPLPGAEDVVGVGPGGRFVPLQGGPGVERAGTMDLETGRPLVAGATLPWSVPGWEGEGSGSPWADPDGTAEVAWDDAAFAPGSPLADPVELLTVGGELPSPARELATLLDPWSLRVGERPPPSAGLASLPASWRATPPAPWVDAELLAVNDEEIVRWILAAALPPARPPTSGSLTSWLLAPELESELPTLPGALGGAGRDLRRELGITP